jgi:hypothetical protein
MTTHRVVRDKWALMKVLAHTRSVVWDTQERCKQKRRLISFVAVPASQPMMMMSRCRRKSGKGQARRTQGQPLSFFFLKKYARTVTKRYESGGRNCYAAAPGTIHPIVLCVQLMRHTMDDNLIRVCEREEEEMVVVVVVATIEVEGR